MLTADQIYAYTKEYISKCFSSFSKDAKYIELDKQKNSLNAKIKQKTKQITILTILGTIVLTVGIILATVGGLYGSYESSPTTSMQLMFGIIITAGGIILIIMISMAHRARKKLYRELDIVNAKIIKMLAPSLEKINLNELSNTIFNNYSSKLNVRHGLNNATKKLMDLQKSSLASSYLNIYTFTYNGYHCLLTVTKNANFNVNLRRLNSCPTFSYKTTMNIYVKKPEGLSFESAAKLKNNNAISDFYKKSNRQSPMDSRDFDRVCPTFRNNETLIRVLFTPSAQDNFVKLDSQGQLNYNFAMANGVFKIQHTNNLPASNKLSLFRFKKEKNVKEKETDDFKYFSIFHDINFTYEPDKLTNLLSKAYTKGLQEINSFVIPFNAIDFFKAPFMQSIRDIDTGEDDLNCEEIEIALNASTYQKDLFYYPIRGIIYVDELKPNSGFKMNTTSYKQIVEHHGNGKDSYTEVYWISTTSYYYCYCIKNDKYKISKYWKYINYELFESLRNSKKVIDVLEVNDHIIVIKHPKNNDQDFYNTMIQTLTAKR